MSESKAERQLQSLLNVINASAGHRARSVDDGLTRTTTVYSMVSEPLYRLSKATDAFELTDERLEKLQELVAWTSADNNAHVAFLTGITAILCY